MRSAEPQITLPGAGVESPQITDPQITREPQIIREPQFTDEPQMAELSDRNLTSFAGKSGATLFPCAARHGAVASNVNHKNGYLMSIS